MPKFILDQGIPRSTRDHLLGAEWDVLHVIDVGLSHARDEEILKFAQSEKRVVVTLDADFHALLAVRNASSPSVIRLRREGLRGADIADLLLSVWKRASLSLEGGAMVSVTDKAIRIRKLPIEVSKQAEGKTTKMKRK